MTTNSGTISIGFLWVVWGISMVLWFQYVESQSSCVKFCFPWLLFVVEKEPVTNKNKEWKRKYRSVTKCDFLSDISRSIMIQLYSLS